MAMLVGSFGARQRGERLRPLPLSVVIVAVLLNGCQRDISGKYLAKFTDGICWLQLVKTPDNHLTGQLETLILRPDGKVERNDVSVTGAVNGRDFTISASAFGLQVLALSGTLAGNRLTLTGVQPSPLRLERSDLNEYEREMNTLNAKAEQILVEKHAVAARQRVAQSQKDFISGVDTIVARMRQFASEADSHLSKFPGAEDRYHAITVKMTEYVNRERQLGGDRNEAVTRAQLAVAVNQASIGTDQLHNAVQSLQSSLQSKVQPISVEATGLEQRCRHANARSDLTPAQIEARGVACERLFQATGPYRQKVEAVNRGLVHLDQIYAQERKTQEGLLQAAQHLE